MDSTNYLIHTFARPKGIGVEALIAAPHRMTHDPERTAKCCRQIHLVFSVDVTHVSGLHVGVG